MLCRYQYGRRTVQELEPPSGEEGDDTDDVEEDVYESRACGGRGRRVGRWDQSRETGVVTGVNRRNP